MPFSTALAEAIKSGDINIISTLITEEKAWDEPNEQGLKPIHVAISYGHLDLVDWLLKNGVSLECATVPNGSTPLHMAAYTGQKKIIEYLLKVCHDNPNKKRANGIEPLYFAAQKGHAEAVILLLKCGANIRQQPNSDDNTLWVAAKNGHRDIVALLLEHHVDIDQAAKDGTSPLYVAARNGHTETVALLLDCGANIRQADKEGASPLFVAAENGHTATVALLLDHHADIGQVDIDGASPLYVAAQNGHVATVALLLKRHADVLQKTDEGTFPLFIAAQLGHTEIVALLLDYAADIHQAMVSGASSLCIAAEMGHVAIVALLLDRGADIRKATNNGVSPLYIAAQKGHTTTVALLLDRGADIRQAMNNGVSPLYIAVQNGHMATVVFLLGRQADIRQADNDGASPLFIAAQQGHTEIAALLLDNAADIHQANHSGASPLYIAARNGHTATVSLLLDHGADIQQTTKDGRSPLYVAASHGHGQTVALLLDHHADVRQADIDGASPLFVAAESGHTATVVLLLDHHADIHSTKNSGASSLYIAAQNGHTTTVAALLEHNADVHHVTENGVSALYVAAHQGHTATVALLLDHHADVNQAMKGGVSPLFIAANFGHTATVSLLLDHGANIGQTDNDGKSPLYVAASNGHTQTVALLLDHDADIQQTTKDGRSPLYVAASHGYGQTVALLLDHHADVRQADIDGASPLFVAAESGHTATVVLLLDHHADIHSTKNSGASSLYIAAQNGHTTTVAALLEHNADVLHVTENGVSALYVAAHQGHTATVALLLDHHADVNQAVKGGASPLYIAAYFGHTETMILLLKHGADIKQAADDGSTSLSIAALEGRTAAVALLLDHHADIRQVAKSGASPLYNASKYGKTETVALLLNRGADIRQATNNGVSPLNIAAQNGHKEIVALLLNHGADIQQSNNYGLSSLYMAAEMGQTQTVALLLEHQADINQTTKDGRSPLYVAASNGHTQTVALLLDHHADINQTTNDSFSALHIAAQQGHAPIVALLLERNADIRLVNNKGASPLYIAAREGSLEVVALLLRYGAPLEQVTLSQRTPLWIAAFAGHAEVVEMLLTNRALMAPDSKGDTPLHIAIKQGHISVVKRLLLKNAAMTSVNAEKQTPLMLAAYSQEAVMFACLLAAWFQQQHALTSEEAEQKRGMDSKKNQEDYSSEDNYNYVDDSYKIVSVIAEKVLPQDISHWPLLPPAALLLAKVMRQSLSLEISQTQWKLAHKLGEGAFGEVFQAELAFGSVALKRMKLAKMAEWFKVSLEEAQAILQWEISQLEKVRHPHVVELLSVAQAETPILAMELCDTTLDKATPKMPYRQWQVAWEVVCGLAYLHDLSLVHRDIKPENILLKEGIAKIADMGLAQIDPLLLDGVEPTQLQGLIGDTQWASPEERTAFKAYHQGTGSLEDIKAVSTAATDIYRYGLVLNSFYQPMWKQIIEACLQPDPKARPSALQVLGALEQTIPHPYPLLAKLCQRLGILAHYHQHELVHFLIPWVSSKANINWLTYQEGIEVKGEDAPQPFTLLWQDFLSDSERRILTVRGAEGLGKTLLGYYQLKEQWQALRQWLIKPEGKPPTLVLLLSPDYLPSRAFTLEERLAEIYQLTPEECETLKQYSVVFLFDGKEEWQSRARLDFYNNWPNAKAWIVSRHYIIAKNSVYLLPFNQVQIIKYLRQTLTWDDTTTQEFILQLPLSAIKEVLRNPFVLSILRLLWPIPHWQALTKETIYHTYFTQFIQRQQKHWETGPYRNIYVELINYLQQQHQTLAESYLRFAGEVSFQLFEDRRLEGKLEIDSPWAKMSEKVQSLAEDAFKERQRLLLANNEKTHLTLHRYQAFALAHLQRFVMPAPLILGYYRFRHQSLFEYAWAYTALLPNRPLDEDEGLLTAYALIHREEKLDFSLIEASKKDPTLSCKAGNLLTVYNWARLPLAYDYQGAYIENANLANANLIHADFRNAHLKNCYFANAYIEKARFDQLPDKTIKSSYPHPPLLGHSQPILCSAISPNGQLLATLDSERVSVWRNQQRIRHFLIHIKVPTALAINDTDELMIGDEDGYVYFYSGDTRQRKLSAHDNPILSLEFIGEDRCWVGSAYSNTIYQRKHLIPQRSWHNNVFSCCSAFHFKTGQHAIGTKIGTVRMNSLKETVVKKTWAFSLYETASTVLTFSLTGTLATGGQDGVIKLFKNASDVISRRHYTNHPIKKLHWSQDGQLLIAITAQGFKVWDLFSRELGNFKALNIQAIYMKNSYQGTLIEEDGNIYGLELKNRELHITWIVAGEHFKGGIDIQPINEDPVNEQSVKEQEEKVVQTEPAYNYNILLNSPLEQHGLFADKNQNVHDQREEPTDLPDSFQKTEFTPDK